MQRETGSLQVGMRADFALWAIERPGELAYGIGGNPCMQVVHAGWAREDAGMMADIAVS
jgi:imidazolonepropionase